jgi:hypothetical protein
MYGLTPSMVRELREYPDMFAKFDGHLDLNVMSQRRGVDTRKYKLGELFHPFSLCKSHRSFIFEDRPRKGTPSRQIQT